jgi:hypothetical protein
VNNDASFQRSPTTTVVRKVRVTTSVVTESP